MAFCSKRCAAAEHAAGMPTHWALRGRSVAHGCHLLPRLRVQGLRRKVPDLAVAGRDATESEGGGKRRKPRGKRTASSILRSVKGKILTWGKPDRYRLGTTEQVRVLPAVAPSLHGVGVARKTYHRVVRC